MGAIKWWSWQKNEVYLKSQHLCFWLKLGLGRRKTYILKDKQLIPFFTKYLGHLTVSLLSCLLWRTQVTDEKHCTTSKLVPKFPYRSLVNLHVNSYPFLNFVSYTTISTTDTGTCQGLKKKFKSHEHLNIHYSTTSQQRLFLYFLYCETGFTKVHQTRKNLIKLGISSTCSFSLKCQYVHICMVLLNLLVFWFFFLSLQEMRKQNLSVPKLVYINQP